MQMARAEEWGSDLVEVTSHMGARPSHAKWQGRIYSLSGNSKKYKPFVETTGYGEVTGLKGANCNHDFYPFFEGLNTKKYYHYDEKENKQVYEARQKQRKIERDIRKEKQKIMLAKEQGDFESELLYRKKLRQKQAKMREHLKKTGLTRHRDREWVYGYEPKASENAKKFRKAKKKADKKVDKNKEKGYNEIKLSKLDSSNMDKAEYQEYLAIINKHQNDSIKNLYSKYGDEIDDIKQSNTGFYSPTRNALEFSYPKYSDMDKYGTLAHEYSHFFDTKAKFKGLNFTEIEKLQNETGLSAMFKNVASSSDEFLEAIRKDKEHIKSILDKKAKDELLKDNASHGVQDAIDGLFENSRIRWGHGEKYYNRLYNDICYYDKLFGMTNKKKLKEVYTDLGFDVSNQTKVKLICRQYEASSEAWANIMSAEVCGGKSLEYVKKYLPNSYEKMMEILEGVE